MQRGRVVAGMERAAGLVVAGQRRRNQVPQRRHAIAEAVFIPVFVFGGWDRRYRRDHGVGHAFELGRGLGWWRLLLRRFEVVRAAPGGAGERQAGRPCWRFEQDREELCLGDRPGWDFGDDFVVHVQHDPEFRGLRSA